MNNFSVSKSLIKLRDRNYDPKISKTINHLLETYNEEQIRILSYNGIFIDNMIKLYFVENVGFRCLNEKSEFYGKMPICNNVEVFMNKLYKESFD